MVRLIGNVAEFNKATALADDVEEVVVVPDGSTLGSAARSNSRASLHAIRRRFWPLARGYAPR